VNANISSSRQRGLNHKRLSASHSRDNCIRFITVQAEDRWPVNSCHSHSDTSNPKESLKISSQWTKEYPDNRSLQVIEQNASLTTHAVVISDNEENICPISTSSQPVSGYRPTGVWYPEYREFNWKHSPDARQATFPHTTTHSRECGGNKLSLSNMLNYEGTKTEANR
jgi:hypothetical protein